MSADLGGATLASVLATGELSRRPPRQPDYHAENAALKALGQRLIDPATVAPLLTDLALDLCRADGAAVSLLERDQSGEWIFRWTHIAGDLGQPAGGSVPRDFSPCGVAVERGCPQLFRHPEQYFTHFLEVRPTIVEGLVIPMRWGDEPLGTIWIVSHDEQRVFDAEDVRMMESLAALTATAIQAARLTHARRQARSDTTEQGCTLESVRGELAALTEAERVRREWLRQLIAAQEEERQRIARELHDQLGPHVTGLALGLQTLREDRLDPGSVDRLRQIVSDIDCDMRRIVRDLRPAMLIDLGLASALKAYVDEWSKHSGIATDFHCHGRQELPAHVETTIYRIVQEALTNAARHSHAQRVSVVLEQHYRHVIAIVEDDGIGFDPTGRAAAGGGRLGLVGMRERATLVGGTCTIESRPGGGATVFIKVPLGIEERPT